MFRVNGATFIGRWYRVLVVLANMLFGLLSGLQPLLPTGSTAAAVQTAIILSLQTSMAILCCRFTPDADRIISTFAATQFTFEAFATAAVLAAAVAQRSAPVTAATNMTDADAVGDLTEATVASTFQTSGFYISLAAMVVPMLQLLE